VHAGEVEGRRFDLVVGADGAGSAVRSAMREQVAGFTVETSTVPNYGLRWNSTASATRWTSTT